MGPENSIDDAMDLDENSGTGGAEAALQNSETALAIQDLFMEEFEDNFIPVQCRYKVLKRAWSAVCKSSFYQHNTAVQLKDLVEICQKNPFKLTDTDLTVDCVNSILQEYGSRKQLKLTLDYVYSTQPPAKMGLCDSDWDTEEVTIVWVFVDATNTYWTLAQPEELLKEGVKFTQKTNEAGLLVAVLNEQTELNDGQLAIEGRMSS